MKAVIKIGGSQYIVTEGQDLTVSKFNPIGSKNIHPEVLMAVSDDRIQVGHPILNTVSVTAEKIDDVKGPKIRIAKYKAKSRYRKTVGFRPQLSILKITSIKETSVRKAGEKQS